MFGGAERELVPECTPASSDRNIDITQLNKALVRLASLTFGKHTAREKRTQHGKESALDQNDSCLWLPGLFRVSMLAFPDAGFTT